MKKIKFIIQNINYFYKDSQEKQQAMLDMIHLKEEAKWKGHTIIKRDNGINFKEESVNYSSRVMDDFLNNLDNIMSQTENQESAKRKI